MGADSSRLTSFSNGEEETLEKTREISRMDSVIRNRVRSGVQHNMKIILRGERGTGKTMLWKRFQGMPYSEKYQPTPEIQSTTINWSFRNGEDTVKVEVWDVVDRAIRINNKNSSSTSAHLGRNNVDLLDAAAVDVYKDTSCVIFMVNPTARSSLEYVRRQAVEVPLTISILILLSFRDLFPAEEEQSESETAAAVSSSPLPSVDSSSSTRVTVSEVHQLCHDLSALRLSQAQAIRLQLAKDYHSHYHDHSISTNTNGSSIEVEETEVCMLEVSLLNCFGLAQLHGYLDLPFLHLKRRLYQQLLTRVNSDLSQLSPILGPSLLTHGQGYSVYKNNYDHRVNSKKSLDKAIADLEGRPIDDQEAEGGGSSGKSHNSNQEKDQRGHDLIIPPLPPIPNNGSGSLSPKQQQQSLLLTHREVTVPSSNNKKDKSDKSDKAKDKDSNKKKKNKDNSTAPTNSKSSNQSAPAPAPTVAQSTAVKEDLIASFKPPSATQPATSSTNANIKYNNEEEEMMEGWLQPSDDEDKMARVNKERIRSYLKPTTTNNMNNDDSDDDNDDNDDDEGNSPKNKSRGGFFDDDDDDDSGNNNNSTSLVKPSPSLTIKKAGSSLTKVSKTASNSSNSNIVKSLTAAAAAAAAAAATSVSASNNDLRRQGPAGLNKAKGPLLPPSLPSPYSTVSDTRNKQSMLVVSSAAAAAAISAAASTLLLSSDNCKNINDSNDDGNDDNDSVTAVITSNSKNTKTKSKTNNSEIAEGGGAGEEASSSKKSKKTKKSSSRRGSLVDTAESDLNMDKPAGKKKSTKKKVKDRESNKDDLASFLGSDSDNDIHQTTSKMNSSNRVITAMLGSRSSSDDDDGDGPGGGFTALAKAPFKKINSNSNKIKSKSSTAALPAEIDL